MGNQQSSLESCIVCKNHVGSDSNLLSRLDNVPAYCSLECQTANYESHWPSLMAITNRDRFNKLLSHLAGIQFKRHTSKSFQKHLCLKKDSLDPCIACRETAKWYRVGAEQDVLKFQHSLGYCYSIGMGVPQSDVEAAKWFGKAAAAGHTPSIRSLKTLFSSISCMDSSSSETEEDNSEDPK